MSKDGDDCEGGDHLTLELQTNLREDYNYIITEKGLLLVETAYKRFRLSHLRSSRPVWNLVLVYK